MMMESLTQIEEFQKVCFLSLWPMQNLSINHPWDAHDHVQPSMCNVQFYLQPWIQDNHMIFMRNLLCIKDIPTISNHAFLQLYVNECKISNQFLTFKLLWKRRRNKPFAFNKRMQETILFYFFYYFPRNLREYMDIHLSISIWGDHNILGIIIYTGVPKWQISNS